MAGLTFDDITGDAPQGAALAAPALAPNGGLSFDEITSGAPSSMPTAQPAAGDDVSTWQHVKNAAGRVGQRIADDAGYVNGLVRTAANAVPIVGAYADQADAATSAALGGSYAGSMAQQQGQDQQFADQHPIAAGAAGLAGAAGGTIAALPDAALGLGSGPLLQRAGTAALGGGALGGADAAARGEDPTTGAVVGGIGGLAAPLVGAGAGAAYRGLRSGLADGQVLGMSLPNSIMGVPIPGIAQAPAPLQGLTPTARSFLNRAMDGATDSEMQGAAAGVGQAGFFGERTPGLLDLSKSVADNVGDGKAVVRGAYQGRMDARNDRVNDLVNGTLGPAQSPIQFQGDINGQIAPYAQAQQDALRNAPPVDISSIYQGAQAALPNTAPGSPENAALARTLRMLGEKPAPVATDGSGYVKVYDADPPIGGPPESGAPPADDTRAATKPPPVGVPRPQTLAQFIRAAGGMQDPGGDLASMGLGNLIARPGQGLGPDAMRQAAAQAGYLGPNIDDAMRFTGVNDLLGRLEDGGQTHSVYDDEAAHLWAQRDAAMAEYQKVGGPTNRSAGGPAPGAPGLPFGGPDVDPMASIAAGAPANVPTTNAQRIYSARQAIDDSLNYDGPTLTPPSSAMRSQQGAYQGVRRGLSDALKDQVPGYGDATDAIAGFARQRQALEDGTKALGGGQSAIRPDDFAAAYGRLSPEEQAAYRVGMRSSVDQALGTRPNDFQALKGVTQGPNGWNQDKLGTAFGSDAAGQLNTGIGQEEQMARNTQRVIGGSPTSENQAVRELTRPDTKTGLLGWLANMRPLDQPATILPPFLHPQNLGERFYAGRYETARNQVAPFLVRSGADADELQSALMEMRRRTGTTASNFSADPLVMALAASAQRARQIGQQ